MKIKLSKSQWQFIGKKTGWMKKAQIIPDDGFIDGGEPYTNEEMDLMEKQTKKANEVKRIKEEVAKIIDEFNNNLLNKEGFELRLKELIREMYSSLGTHKNTNVD